MPFNDDGFEIVDDFISPHALEAIQLEASQLEVSHTNLTTAAGGIRNANKKLASVQTLLNQSTLPQAAECYLPNQAQFVRAILFDKTPKNNWLVTWHQDKTIAVSNKLAIKNWGPWSMKDGIHHVQPDIEVLNQMVTFRIHIDESNEHNGCLRVIPGSHQHGIMSQAEINTYVSDASPVQCLAKPGSALVMRPHILHASSKARKPSHRRVLHVEFSSCLLPEGLEWD